MRATLSTIRLAISLVYSSGRRQLLSIIVADVVTSIAIAGQLLVGRTLLDLLADSERVDAGDLAPYLVALGVLLMVSAMSQAVASELRIPLGEQVYRRAMDEILDVATEVELEAYEGSEFHDRLQRRGWPPAGSRRRWCSASSRSCRRSSSPSASSRCCSRSRPSSCRSRCSATSRSRSSTCATTARATSWSVELTELQRDRAYLEYVMTDRIEAKEIRSYEVAPTLRAWHAELWDTRMAQSASASSDDG